MNQLDLWALSLFCDYSPDQPRDEIGRFTGGVKRGKIKKTKYARSKQSNFGKVQLEPDEYGIVRGALTTFYPNLKNEDSAVVTVGTYIYHCVSDGLGGYACMMKEKVRRGRK